MVRAVKNRIVVLLVAIILWFPISNLYQRTFLSTEKLEVTCTVATEVPLLFELFYDSGNGWESDRTSMVSIDQIGIINLLKFEPVRTQKASRLRIDVDLLDTSEGSMGQIELREIRVSSGHLSVDLLSEAENTSVCLDVQSLELNQGVSVIPTCGDAQLIFKTDHLAFDLQKWTTSDIVWLVLLILMYSAIVGYLLKLVVVQLEFGKAKLSQSLLVVVFGFVLASHWYLSASGFGLNDPTLEKRVLAKFPNRDSKEYATEFDSWFEDHYAARQKLTRLNSLIHYHGFNKSPMKEKLVIGTNDQMYPSSEFILDDFMGRMKLSDLQKISVRKNLMERVRFMQKFGKDYYLILPPSKQTVYPYEVPFRYQKTWDPDSTMMSQLMRYLIQDSLLSRHVCDPRPALTSAAEIADERVYFDADIHWNAHGAFIGYFELFHLIAKKYPDLKPHELNDFEIEKIIDNKGDLARLLMLHNDIPRINYSYSLRTGPLYMLSETEGKGAFPIYTTTVADSSLPKALVFRDSYCQDMIQFIGLHFSEAKFIWNQEFDLELIKKDKPDFVIQEVTEMMIYDLLRVNPKEIQIES